MKRTTLLVIAVFAFLFSAQAVSQTQTPVINQRERNQQARIRQGVKSGQLTPGEARRLEAQQGKIKADKMAAKSDGKVTPAERRHLKRELNRASRNIHRKKHNARKASK